MFVGGCFFCDYCCLGKYVFFGVLGDVVFWFVVFCWYLFFCGWGD